MATPTPNFGWQLPVPNSPIDANVWGTELNGNLSAQDTQLLSAFTNNISSTAPVSPILTGGSTWINNSNSGLWVYNVFDGTEWVSIGTINTVSHTFSSISASSVPSARIFTTSGTYTPTAGITYAIVEGVGGGGSGGTSTYPNGPSGGGGGGGYFWAIAPAATIGSSQAITIGTGGANGAGGTTSFGSLYIGNGGGVGGNSGSAGAGGTASGSQLNVTGGKGGASVSGAYGGAGANSLFLGNGGFFFGNPSTGNPASGYGAGGSGTLANGSSGSLQGGNGSSGLIRIVEYF